MRGGPAAVLVTGALALTACAPTAGASLPAWEGGVGAPLAGARSEVPSEAFAFCSAEVKRRRAEAAEVKAAADAKKAAAARASAMSRSPRVYRATTTTTRRTTSTGGSTSGLPVKKVPSAEVLQKMHDNIYGQNP